MSSVTSVGRPLGATGITTAGVGCIGRVGASANGTGGGTAAPPGIGICVGGMCAGGIITGGAGIGGAGAIIDCEIGPDGIATCAATEAAVGTPGASGVIGTGPITVIARFGFDGRLAAAGGAAGGAATGGGCTAARSADGCE